MRHERRALGDREDEDEVEEELERRHLLLGAEDGAGDVARACTSVVTGHLRASLLGDRTVRYPLRAVISTNQFKNGTHIEVDGTIFRILEFQHVKPGKGGAFVRTKLRSVDDGSVIDKTFRAGEKFRPVRTETKRMQFLYDAGDAAVFMDTETTSSSSSRRPVAGDAMRWVLPNDEVEVLFVDERPPASRSRAPSS